MRVDGRRAAEHEFDRLHGVTIGTETYVLVGEERLQKPTVGRAIRKLFVQTISKADSAM